MVRLLFTVGHKEGALEEVLGLFKRTGISLTRIESLPSKSSSWAYDILVDFDVVNKEHEDKLAALDAQLADTGVVHQFIEPSTSGIDFLWLYILDFF